MPREALHVVTCVSNPLQIARREELTRAFISHMLESGVELTLVETAYADRPFVFEHTPDIRFVGTRARTMAWSKESALNVGFRALPSSATKAAWIDADVEFRSKTWVQDTLDALDIDVVVQPWSEALDLGPDGEIMTVKDRSVQTSFGYVYRELGHINDWWKNPKAYAYPHSGYAWAARLDFLDRVGLLLDFSGLGAADHQMALGMVGQPEAAIHGLSSDSYRAQVQAWGERAFKVCQGHVGYVKGRIEHAWHGEKALRKYVERWDILNRHAFDPVTDLHRNRWGILELSGNKPQLERDIRGYFAQRNEDANCRQVV